VISSASLAPTNRTASEAGHGWPINWRNSLAGGLSELASP